MNMGDLVHRAKTTGEIPKIHATRREVLTFVPNAKRFRYKINVKLNRWQTYTESWEKYFLDFEENQHKGSPFDMENNYASRKAGLLSNDFSRLGVHTSCNAGVYTPSKKERIH